MLFRNGPAALRRAQPGVALAARGHPKSDPESARRWIGHGAKQMIRNALTHHEIAFDDGLIEVAKDADCLIYDAMYTAEEYTARATGWGHSTWDQGVRIATAAEVKSLFLFHHDPERSDDAVDAIEADATRQFRGAVAAREGIEYRF